MSCIGRQVVGGGDEEEEEGWVMSFFSDMLLWDMGFFSDMYLLLCFEFLYRYVVAGYGGYF
jgi:hypothetical protein